VSPSDLPGMLGRMEPTLHGRLLEQWHLNPFVSCTRHMLSISCASDWREDQAFPRGTQHSCYSVDISLFLQVVALLWCAWQRYWMSLQNPLKVSLATYELCSLGRRCTSRNMDHLWSQKTVVQGPILVHMKCMWSIQDDRVYRYFWRIYHWLTWSSKHILHRPPRVIDT
jgi:hypothetical protein